MEADEEVRPAWELELEAELGDMPDDSPLHESTTPMLPPRKRAKVKHPLWHALVLQPLGIIEEDFPTSGGRCNICSITLLYGTLVATLFMLSHLLGFIYETLLFTEYEQAYRQRLEGYLVLLFLTSVAVMSMAFFTYVKIWCRKKVD